MMTMDYNHPLVSWFYASTYGYRCIRTIMVFSKCYGQGSDTRETLKSERAEGARLSANV